MQSLTINPSLPIIRCLTFRYKFKLKTFLILNFILIAGLLVFYIFQINTIVRGTYLIKDYETNLNKVSQENKILENNLAQSNSLGNIESLAKSLNYEKVGEVRYIQIMGSSVVAK